MSKFINDIYEHLAILLSNKISFGFFHQRYFIGYLYNDSKVMPLHIMLTTVLKTTTFNCIKKNYYNYCYIGETKRHLPTRIKEHLQTDKKSHILQHLNENPNCRDLCDDSCFTIIDHASSSFRLKLKEALHITWLKPVLNKQKNHVSITISV